MKLTTFLQLVLIIVIGEQNAFAQTPKNSLKVDSTKIINSKWAINGGIGFTYGFGDYGQYSPTPIPLGPAGYDDDKEMLGASPEYGAVITRNIKRFGIGVAISYQTEIFSNVGRSGASDNISRLNMAIRTLYHLNKYNRYFDNYIGIRAGCSYWHDIFIPQAGSGYVVAPGYAIGAATLYKPSFQVFYGLSLFPGGGCFGFNLEIGIGTPYLAECGIAFRF